jgi:hypothetical protein
VNTVKLCSAALISSVIGFAALPAVAATQGGISQLPPAPAAAVPEPATWAMMLLGIAVLGVAMRLRRRATV